MATDAPNNPVVAEAPQPKMAGDAPKNPVVAEAHQVDTFRKSSQCAINSSIDSIHHVREDADTLFSL